MECFGFLLVLGAVGLVVFLAIKIGSHSTEIGKLQRELLQLHEDVDALRHYASRLRDLVEDYARKATSGAADAPTATEPGAPQPVTEQFEEPAPPVVEVEVPPATAPPEDVFQQPSPEAVGEMREPELTSTAPPSELPGEHVVQPAAAARDQFDEEPLSEPRTDDRESFAKRWLPGRKLGSFVDWENIVGIKLFSAIAGVALVLAAVFFIKYSVERGWLGPEIRAAIGLIAGATLLVVCEAKIARDYRFTANALHGAGIAILYATLFAIHAVWHLAPAAVVFGLMLLVTAIAVGLSVRRDSIFIAVLGMLGGFATPALLSSGENQPVGLFSYLMLLNVGLSWIAYKRRWPALTFGSLLLTAIYQWAWVGKFLDAAQLPMAAGIFAVFAAAGSFSLWSHHRREDDANVAFRRMALTSLVLPVAFAVFVAAVPAYGHRFHTLFAFLLLVCSGLTTVAYRRNYEWLHTVSGAAAVGTFAVWSVVSYTGAAWPVLLGWVSAFIALFLFISTKRDWIGNFAAPALFFVFPLLAIIEPRTASPAILFGGLFGLLVITAAVALSAGRSLLYFVAAAFAVLAQGSWAALHLDAERLTGAFVIFGAFGVLMLAVPELARRFGRTIEPRLAPGVSSLVSMALLFFLATRGVAAASLWGLAVILGLLLIGTMREARIVGQPLLAVVASALSWMILAVWWISAPLPTSLIPGLAVVAALSLVILGDAIRNGGAADDDVSVARVYIALFAHGFLAFVASDTQLSIPPWPLFAVLAVVDLAFGLAAVVLRRPMLMLCAVVATDLILFDWSNRVDGVTWANVALAAAVTTAAWAVLWRSLFRRLSRMFKLAAYAALLGGHVIVMVAGDRGGEAVLPALLACHLLLAITTLVLTWRTHDFELAPISAALTALAIALAPTADQGFGWRMGVATSIYVVYLAYTLLLGHRAGRSLFPALATVLSGAAYFFFARDAMMDAGYGWMIGVLPVTQAIAMLAVLVRLLKIERPRSRQLNRLAMVAGTALAFITVAVPLQLDRQWITVAWALEGAALIWLFRRIPHRGLLAWGGALLAVSFIRLALNPLALEYYPSSTPILNWYLYAYLITAASLFAAAWYVPAEVKHGRTVAAGAATFLLFVLLNIEIADFYTPRGRPHLDFISNSLAQDLTYTFGWALFALALLIAGIVFAKPGARISALVLLVLTIFKCFLHDLGNLAGLYRVASLVGLAFCLVAVGVLIQKFVVNRSSRLEVTA